MMEDKQKDKPAVDVSSLPSEDETERRSGVPWQLLIFCGAIVLVMVACIIVICVLANNGALIDNVSTSGSIL